MLAQTINTNIIAPLRALLKRADVPGANLKDLSAANAWARDLFVPVSESLLLPCCWLCSIPQKPPHFSKPIKAKREWPGPIKSIQTGGYMPIPSNIYFDRELIENLRDEAGFWWKLSWVYRSNWRILHIDGLEGGRRIPICTGKLFQFFQYGASDA